MDDQFSKVPDRVLATIERIVSVNPIPKADQIEVVRVLGWDVVVRKADKFKVGDLCIYCQIDSILPATEWSSFLEDSRYRIKTIRLRKQVSQGIVFPLDILEGHINSYKKLRDTNDVEDLFKEGDDYTEIIGVRQYVPVQLRVKPRYMPRPGKKLTFWQRIKNYFFVRRKTRLNRRLLFPTNLVPKTKEIRIQNSPSILRNNATDLVSITEKVDGMSMTVVRNNMKYSLLTRNWKVSVEKNGEENVRLYEAAFQNEKIKQKLIKVIGNYAIQGEIVGPGIAGSGKKSNIYDLPEVQMFVFNVWNIDTQQYLNYFEFLQFVKKYKLRAVPNLGHITLPGTIDEMVEESKGKSKVNPKIIREGVVVRSRDMNQGRWNFSFKCINPDYLLKHEE